jgi:hypothetical protein
MLQAEARTAELERGYKEVIESASWRLTGPLRRLNILRKARRRGWS